MVRAISLKVEKSKTNDVGQNVVRLDQRKREKIGIDLNDAVIVRSNIGVITAIVKTVLKHDVGKNILRLDEKQRQMVGVDDGNIVDIINYLDYKIEEEKLKPQPLSLKKDVPNQVIYTQHYQQTVADNVVSGDYVGGSMVSDSVVQKSSLGNASDENLVTPSPEKHRNINKIIFCSKCGSEHENDSSFCTSCGTKISE